MVHLLSGRTNPLDVWAGKKEKAENQPRRMSVLLPLRYVGKGMVVNQTRGNMNPQLYKP